MLIEENINTPVEIHFYHQPQYSNLVKEFLEHYDFEDILYANISNLPYLKDKKDRVCRFCGRSYGESKFNSEAHLIPEMLGNKYLFFDSECDECNNFFGSYYEDHLSNMLGMYRTISKVRSKNGHPTFKSPGQQLVARVKPLEDSSAVFISREVHTNETIKVDVENATMSITYKKHSYVPIMAYKALLKIALSIIKEKEVREDYRYALDYLLNKTDKVLNGCRVTGYSLSFSYIMPPHAILYKKRNPDDKVLTHVLALYFLNMIFTLPVPLNQKDFFFYGEDVAFYTCPPLFFLPMDLNNLVLRPFDLDLSSREKLVERKIGW